MTKTVEVKVNCKNINFNENEHKDEVPHNNQPNGLSLFEILEGGKVLQAKKRQIAPSKIK